MSTKRTPLQIDLTRWCDMRHEEVRKSLDHAELCGAVLSKADHLRLHRGSFAAGVRAAIELNQRQLSQMIEQDAALDQPSPNVIPFTLEASAERFREWPTGGTGLPLPEGR